MKIEDVKVGAKVVAHDKTEGVDIKYFREQILGVPLYVIEIDSAFVLLNNEKDSKEGYSFNASDFEPYEEPLKVGNDVVSLCNSCKHSRWNCVPNKTAWDEKYNITNCSQYVLSDEKQQQQNIKHLHETLRRLSEDRNHFQNLWCESTDKVLKLQEEIKNLQYENNRLNVAKVRLKEANEAWQNEIKQLNVEKARYRALWFETDDMLKKCPVVYTKIKEDKNGHQVIACYTSAEELRKSEDKDK